MSLRDRFRPAEEAFLAPKAAGPSEAEAAQEAFAAAVAAVPKDDRFLINNTAADFLAVAAAVDALSEFGVKHVDMMLRPEKLWRIIQGGHS